MAKAKPRKSGATGWLWPLALVVFALGLYSNALDNPFLGDDERILTKNPTVAEPGLAALGRLWTSDYWTGTDPRGRTERLSEDRNLYRPVTTLSLWLNSAVVGLSPSGFRCVNVGLHACAAWLVGLWCGAWLGRGAGRVASVIFLLHPVATDVVNRVVGRADILALCGVVGFLVVHCAALRDRWTWSRAALAGLAVAVALGAKEAGSVVLPMALLQEWLRRSDGEPRRRWRGWLALGVPLALYAAARLAVVGASAYGPVRGWDLLQNPLAGKSLVERLPSVLSLGLYYARLCVAPWPLVTFDLPARLPAWSDPSPWLGLVVLSALAAAGAWWAVRRDAALLGPGLWLLAFLVVSQLILPIGTYSDVRLAYLPLAGAVLLAVRAGATIVAPARSRARAGVLALSVGLAIVAVVGVRHRNAEFQSAIVLFEADLRRRPGAPGAMLRLGTMYRAAQRWSDAARLLEETTRLAPESSQAWFELGVLRAARGDTEGAKWSYRQALRFRPSDAGALMNLGVLELKARNLGAAESLFQAAYAVNPDGLLLKYNMALLDASRGRNDAAMRRLREVLDADPDLVRVEQVLSFLERNGRLPRPEEELPLAGS